MDLKHMREAYVGKRLELPGRGLLACPKCGSHLVCYSVVPYSRLDGRGRDAQMEQISAACLLCSQENCGYTSVLPLSAKAVLAIKTHTALPEQLQAVRPWLIEIHEEENIWENRGQGDRSYALR